jgi:hypothetical protein
MEAGKMHAQVHCERAGLCPTCLERYTTGRGGAKTQLVEEERDGVKTGSWICPHGRPSYPEGGLRGLVPWVF